MTYKEKDYRVFAMFEKDWALVTAGTIERFNSCTVGWGSLGNMWGDGRSTVTVYVHPARYTSEFLKENEEFTVSFLPKSQKRALAYMGIHSGRTENKAEAAGLTPVAVRNSVTYEEAELTFVCRKLYQHQKKILYLTFKHIMRLAPLSIRTEKAAGSHISSLSAKYWMLLIKDRVLPGQERLCCNRVCNGKSEN